MSMKWQLILSTILLCSGQVWAAQAQQTQQMMTANQTAELSVASTLETSEQVLTTPKIALVLGSGGARGYAHIGAIEVLEQAGIRPDFIVGASAGSIVGAMYASGMNAAQLRQAAMDMRPSDVRDVTLHFKGFFDGKKVQNYVNKKIAHRPLEQLDIPMYVVATELQYGKKVVFDRGDTGQAVRASISIPSMFVPTKIDGREYVDGGVSSPVPVQVAKSLGADIVIAVDILAQPEHTETSNIWHLFNQNIHIMQYHLAAEELKHADVVIQPDLREKSHIFNVRGREQTMQAGAKAALNQLPQVQEILTVKQHPAVEQVKAYLAEQQRKAQ